MMHNYYDRPIDIFTTEEIRNLFIFGSGGEWYNLSQTILWLGNRLRYSKDDDVIIYHANAEESGTILAQGTNLFYDFFLDLTPWDIKSFGNIFVYNKDKNETYVVQCNEFKVENEKYKFYTEEGKY